MRDSDQDLFAEGAPPSVGTAIDKSTRIGRNATLVVSHKAFQDT